MSITNKTVLVTLKIEMLGIEERDRKLTTDVNVNYLNVVNAGFYHKSKIDRRHFRTVRAAAHAARIYHRSVTVPWDGVNRLLAASRTLEYTNKMSTFKINFENAVNDLKNQWPAIIAAEQLRLGSSHNLFNPADYPNQSDLLKFFSFAHIINPVPDSSHLILDIESDVVNELKAKLDKENIARVDDAKRNMYQRLLQPISRMAEVCSSDKKVYDTMIKDVVDVTSLLTELSVVGDAELLQKLADVKTKLVGFTTGQIRNDPKLKKKLGADAAIIASQLKSNLGTAPPVT